MADIRYSQEHQWALIENGVANVGISDFAQSELGDIVYLELPDEGIEVTAGDHIATVESVKTASEVFAPVSGTIINVNNALSDAPESINDDPEGSAWFVMIEMSDAGEVDNLMTQEEYLEQVGEE